MPIQLTTHDIDAAIPKIADGLAKYLRLQFKATTAPGFHSHPEFQRKFNGFYRVRRAAEWRAAFFALLGRTHREQLEFHAVLELLRAATNRYEASFASKLFATVNPSAPVIDSVVLKNLGLRIPPASASNRAAGILRLHNEISRQFAEFLTTQNGKYLVQKFDAAYPTAAAIVTPEKKLDLVLWQSRANNPLKGRRAKRARRIDEIVSR